MKQILLALALVAVCTGSARADDPIDPSVFLIPREELATKERQPFSLLWEYTEKQRLAAGEGHNFVSIQYVPSLERFPGASACLVEEERDKPVQNLLAFDWPAIETWTDLEVCIGHTANSLRIPELIVEWMRRQGFQPIYLKELVSPDGPYIFSLEPLFSPDEQNNYFSISALMTPELRLKTSMVGGWEYFYSFFSSSAVWSMWINLEVKTDGQTLATNVEYNQ